MSRWSSFFRIAAAAVAAYFGQWGLAATFLQGERNHRAMERDKRRAIEQWNNAQVDRLELIEGDPAQPRTLCLGRVRYVEGVRRYWTSGTNDEKLTLIVSFAGHEIDGFEQWYLDDIPITLDVDGWVKRASYGTASGYTTTAAGFAKGVTSLPLITGTGTMLVGDVFRVDGDPTYYTVTTGITAPGTVSFTPALLQAIPASARAVTLFSHPYNQVRREVRQEQRVDNGTVTLDSGFVASTVTANWTTGSGHGTEQGPATVASIVGSTATIADAPGGSTVVVNYEVEIGTPYVRIRPYVGTDSQNVGSDIAAEYPGKISSADKFAGIALAVVDFVWSQEAFPSGRPTPSAVFRGAKCYDWSKDSTVSGGSGSHRQATPSTWEWTENPALCAGRYFAWVGGWGCDLSWARVADMQAAAAVCATSTNFTVDGAAVTLPRYRCGLTIPSNADHQAAMDAIVETMAGRHVWVGDSWRLRAGALGSTAFTIDESWLGMSAGEEMAQDDDEGEPWIRATQALPAQQRTNRVIGSCVDPDQRYQMVPYPAVEDATLIAAKGTRQDQLDLTGVNHIAHAQYLGKIKIREAQAGLRMALMCGWKGWKAEPLDVVEITLPTYGISAKTMEVTETHVDPTGGFPIALAEITAAIFDTTAALEGRDPAPDSNMRRPWEVEALTGLTVSSGATAVLDTSILTRTQVSWDPAVGEYIRKGGHVEIQYTEAAAALPSGVDWPSVRERGDTTATVITGLLTGRYYLFRARFVQDDPPVPGPWTEYGKEKIAAPPLVDTGGIEDGAATYTDSAYTASGSTVGSPGPGDEFTSSNATLHTLAWTNSTAATRKVQIEFSGTGYRNPSGGGGAMRFRYEYSVSGGGSTLAVNGPEWISGTAPDREYARAYQVDVAAGQTITVLHRYRLSYGGTGSSQNAAWSEVTTRLTAILK